MRDMNPQSPIKFAEDVKDYIQRRLPKRILDLRKLILDNPNFLDIYENNIRVKTKESETLLSLLVLSWYLPRELGFLLREEIFVKKQFNKYDSILKSIFESSFEETLSFLILTQRWHSRDFFGNFLKKGLRELENIKFQRRNTKKIFKGDRKRGYQDHGSRRPETKWLPYSDWSFTEMQNLKEKKELRLHKLKDRIKRKLRKNFLILFEDFKK
jgi:hypothetical protein